MRSSACVRAWFGLIRVVVKGRGKGHLPAATVDVMVALCSGFRAGAFKRVRERNNAMTINVRPMDVSCNVQARGLGDCAIQDLVPRDSQDARDLPNKVGRVCLRNVCTGLRHRPLIGNVLVSRKDVIRASSAQCTNLPAKARWRAIEGLSWCATYAMVSPG